MVMYSEYRSMSSNEVLTCVFQLPALHPPESCIDDSTSHCDISTNLWNFEAAQRVDGLFRDGGMGSIIAVDRQGNGKRSSISALHILS